MTKFKDLSLIKRIGIVSLLLLAIFIIAGAHGYFRGLYGDDGSTTRATSWALKTGFLWVLLPIISIILGRVGDSLGNYLNLRLPYFLNSAILLGCTFAILDGGSILLEIETGEFWSKVLNGFVIGGLGGGIGLTLAQKTEKAQEVDNSAS
ncbi:MAG: hypothetical protein AAF383_15890 [Cyanobacteria bacterium P01_A01_bin.83]